MFNGLVGASNNPGSYSHADYNQQLGQADVLVVQIICDGTTLLSGTDTISANHQVSSDNVTWVPSGWTISLTGLNAATTGFPYTTAGAISASNTFGGGTTLVTAYQRFLIAAATNPNWKCRVIVCGRTV